MNDETLGMSILYGRAEDGTLKHVDDVPNGKACGCVCAACGQRLNAKNGGKKVMHHFAHVSGECKWSADQVVTELLLLSLQEAMTIGLPTYRLGDGDNWGEGHGNVLLPRQTVTPITAELSKLSGRGASEVVVEYEDNEGQEHKCAIVVSFAHSLQEDSVEELRRHVDEIILIDLFQAQKDRRRELLESRDGRHFDRAEVAREFQDPLYLSTVLVVCDARYKCWVANKDGEQAERAYWKRQEEAQREAQAKLQKAIDEERKVREEEERARELEVADTYNVWRWYSEELSETERLAYLGDIRALLTTTEDRRSVMVMVGYSHEAIDEVAKHVDYLRSGADSFSVAIDLRSLQRARDLRIETLEDHNATMAIVDYFGDRIASLIGDLVEQGIRVTVQTRGNQIYRVMGTVPRERKLLTKRMR